MNSCLIGHTGFVGKNLKLKKNFTHKFNSRNIEKISKKYKLIVCAGASGWMYLANKYPKKDNKNIKKLINNLKKTSADYFILISTIQVLKNLKGNENNKKFDKSSTYRKNRLLLENFCKKHFKNCFILRLPSLFGYGLNKNLIFDIFNPVPSFLEIKKYKKYDHILKKNYRKFKKLYILKNTNFSKKDQIFFQEKKISSIFKFNNNSVYQFYYLKNLWNDIKYVCKNNIKIMHLASHKLKASEIYYILKNEKMPSCKGKIYSANMKSLYYKKSKENLIKDLQHFKKNYSHTLKYSKNFQTKT